MRYEEFTIEGRNAVIEAYRAGRPIDKLFILDGCQDGPILTIKREAKAKQTPVKFVTKERLDQLSETGKHQGVIAYAAAYEYATVEEILDNARQKGEAPFLFLLDELKTKAAERNIPLPVCLAECLKAAKETSTSEYVVSNRDGEPLSYTQFKRLWQYIVTRTVKERSYYRYEDGKRVKHTVTPVLGEKAAHNGKVVYSLDFEVTPHQLRHTYITNLIHASVDPKTVQYLAGHESSKITMDIYAKVKYNRPDELVRSMSCAFASWDAAQ